MLTAMPAAWSEVIAGGAEKIGSTSLDGELLAQTCFGCHGPQGASRAPAIPSLSGLSESYFINTMRAYQYGGRNSTVMDVIALAFSDEELRLMAEYFARFDFQTIPQRMDWRLVDKGRKLHIRYCRNCHGDQQKEAEERAVRLNGQWASYLRWTLKDYLVGINQTEGEMSERLTQLVKRQGQAGLEALVHYYASARP